VKLIKCAECDKDLSISADSCVHCGSKSPFKDLTLLPNEQKGMTYKERKSFIKGGGKLKSSLLMKVWFSIILLFILFFIFSPKEPLTAEQKANEIKEQLENKARYACQYQLEQRLYVPDSVEYLRDLLDRIVINKGNGEWFVQLNYKSKNKFGVLLKNQVQCEIVQKGDQFTVINLINNK
jgi:hypothetical protein